MKVKLFEIRDRATFIPVICIKLSIDNDDVKQVIKEDYLLKRAGYGNDPERYVLMTRLSGDGMCNYDIYAWGGRTYLIAHEHIIEYWDTLVSGDVIDVEFILGETKEIKISERLETFDYDK